MNGHELDAPLGPTLSGRERQVLRHLARDRTNQAIAQLLSVSESTVKTHVLHIYDKLDYGLGSI